MGERKRYLICIDPVSNTGAPGMQEHDIYNLAATLDDIPEERRETLTESVGELFAAPAEVRLAESPNGVAELQVPETIPSSSKLDIKAVVESCVEYSLDSYEAIVLNQRVGWPEPRYEICVDFE